MLRLTAADFAQSGSALVAVPSHDSMSEWSAEFDMYVGGGNGGEGLSFNVGSLPPTYFGERGIRSALSVELQSAAQRLEVWHSHVLLARSGEPVEVSRGRFERVAVSYTHLTLPTILLV